MHNDARATLPKPRILVVHNHYRESGGESTVFENEVRGLRAHGHEVVLYEKSNEVISRLSLLRKVAATAASYSSLATKQALARLISERRPAVAIVQNVFPLISPSAYAVLQAYGVPIIQAVYNYRFICPAAELYSQGELCERCVKGSFTHAVMRRCYRDSHLASAWYASIIGVHRALGTFSNQIDAFMVPDDFMAQKLVEGGLPASKMWRNANPFFLPPKPGPSRHKGYVLYVGRLIRQKGVLTAIEAMRHVKTATKLLVVGSGALEAEIMRMIEEVSLADRVSFLGPKWGAELAELMAGALAVLVPSEWYDNLPQVICQANGAGKPVIASRINGIPEYVAEGRSGYLFEPGDHAELARIVDRVAVLSSDEYARLAHTSRDHAEESFDYEIHYNRLRGLIDMLTSEERHARV